MIWQSLLYLKLAGQIFWYYLYLHDWFLIMYSAILSTLNLYEEEDIFLSLFVIALILFHLFLLLLLLSVFNFYIFLIVQRKEF